MWPYLSRSFRAFRRLREMSLGFAVVSLDVRADRRQIEVRRHRFDDTSVVVRLEQERVRLVLPRDAVLVEEPRVLRLGWMSESTFHYSKIAAVTTQ